MEFGDADCVSRKTHAQRMEDGKHKKPQELTRKCEIAEKELLEKIAMEKDFGCQGTPPHTQKASY